MNRHVRFVEAYKFLYKKGYVHKQKDVGDAMGASESNVSVVMRTGNERVMTENFLVRFAKAFPIISLEWLLYGTGEMIKEDKPEQPAPAPSSSQSDAIIDIYAHLISDLETMRAQTLQTLNEVRAMKSEIEDLRHDYLDALARLERAISNIDSLDTPSIGIAAEDTKRGCS